MPWTARPLAERFGEKVDQNGPIHPALGSRCWVWTASTNGDGYGQLYVEPKMQKAHRISWQLYVGPIPEGALVLHHCDNPPCVNPAHLFLGTTADNRAFDEANTRVAASGKRSCRACGRAYYHLRRKAS